MRRRNGPKSPSSEPELLRRAVELRDEWLRRALSTDPADRPAAEAAITGLYESVGARSPRFLWVDSPEAMRRLDPGERPDPPPTRPRSMRFDRPGTLPLSSRLASHMSDLRHAFDGLIEARLARYSRDRTWRATAQRMSPRDALRAGVPLRPLLEVTVADSLRHSVHDTVAAPLRATLHSGGEGPFGLLWTGQHDAHWVARYDVWRRLGLLSVSADRAARLDLWAALVRSCGWWWPGERVCVVAERPRRVAWESLARSPHGQIRLHREDGPAVEFADGWGCHVLHGTPVPEWVVDEPTAERIAAERNIEVRRTAIERLGWEVYIEQAGLRLLAAAPDPGNPGCELRLYEPPRDVRVPPHRVLVAVNGSVERDGTRRRYGLTVPDTLDDPVSAAGWSYGLSGQHYARLVRRT